MSAEKVREHRCEPGPRSENVRIPDERTAVAEVDTGESVGHDLPGSRSRKSVFAPGADKQVDDRLTGSPREEESGVIFQIGAAQAVRGDDGEATRDLRRGE